jgi:PleD family two-component response regulator
VAQSVEGSTRYEHIVARADAAMYRAKAAGKDRVAVDTASG